MHLLQFAPTIAFHLALANQPRQLAALVRMFVDSETQTRLDALEDAYNKGVGGARMAGGRRRMTNKAKEHTGLRAYPMSAEDRKEMESILDS